MREENVIIKRNRNLGGFKFERFGEKIVMQRVMQAFID